jgi:hypothetical protein
MNIDLTRKSFNIELNGLSENDEILALCLNYIKNSNNINAIRDAQDVWIKLDKKSTFRYYEESYKNNPKSAQATYLYGRLLLDRLERVKLGRRSIELDPKWPYGYRLVL